MKKLLLALLFLAPVVAIAANTTEFRDGSYVITSSQINTSGATSPSTSAVSLGKYQSGSIQCAWRSVTGTQPVFKLQFSNDNSNWDNVSGATTTTTGADGSSTFVLDPFVSRYARVYVSTTSTAGTLDCVTVAK